MKNPFVLLLRHIALRRNESDTPHCLCPLDRIRTATVLVTPMQEDSDAVKSAVKQYFSYNNIPVNIISPGSGELNLAGAIKKKFRGERLPEGSGELLISLADTDSAFWPEYEARCSTRMLCLTLWSCHPKTAAHQASRPYFPKSKTTST